MIRLTALSCALCASVVFAGDLDPPPGPVAPSLKTLVEVEPRTAINPVNTPGDADSVFRIDSDGSYYLVGDVSAGAGQSGIEIEAENVTLDLNGFGVRGAPGSLDGITCDGPFAETLAVRNGSVSGFGGAGVNALATGNVVVADLSVRDVQGDGINVGNGRVVRCDVSRTGGFGIRVSTGSIESCSVAAAGVGVPCFEIACCGSMLDCRATGSSGTGFNAQSDVVIEGCVATATADGFSGPFGGVIIRDCNANFCQEDGFDVVSPATLTGCVARGCGGFGVNASGPVRVEATIVEDNTLSGIAAGEGALITSCVARGNGSVVLDAGILAGAGSTVTGCSASLNTGRGIALTAGNADGGVIADCTARENTGDGIAVETGATVRGCSSSFNGGDGIDTISGCTVIECSVRINGEDGIESFDTCTIIGCSSEGNQVDGFSVRNGSTVTSCSSRSNGDDGFDATSAKLTDCYSMENSGSGYDVIDSTVKDCVALENDANGVQAIENCYVVGCNIQENAQTGILVTGTDNRIDSNTLSENNWGIRVFAFGNVIVRNTVGASVVEAYTIIGDNDVGTIQVSPVGAGAWDNFEYR